VDLGGGLLVGEATADPGTVKGNIREIVCFMRSRRRGGLVGDTKSSSTFASVGLALFQTCP
jgi:hypothetical protein